jgi:hypothetical protein
MSILPVKEGGYIMAVLSLFGNAFQYHSLFSLVKVAMFRSANSGEIAPERRFK